MEMRKIIFVDDEPNILQGLRRMLRGMRGQWHLAFAGSGREALALLEQERFDIVISDMRMPEMDGLRFLSEIREKHPHMVRIILSGHSDQDALLEATRIAHQFLSKPCDMATLKECVDRITEVRDILEAEALKNLVGRINTLPSVPSLYLQVNEELKRPHSSMAVIGGIIEKDVAMSAKILQLVSSAFFGLPKHVVKPVDAVCLLGMETIRGLVFAIGVFSQFSGGKMAYFSLDTLLRHSILSGSLALKIAEAEGLDKLETDAVYIAAMLHDVGKLVLADNFPEVYDNVMKFAAREGVPLGDVEYRMLGARHEEVGAYLLGLWGFPQAVIEPIVYHHRPSRCDVRHIAPVYAANLFAHICNGEISSGVEKHIGDAVGGDPGLLERLHSWWEICCPEELQESPAAG